MRKADFTSAKKEEKFNLYVKMYTKRINDEVLMKLKQ